MQAHTRTLAVRPPFRWDAIVAFLSARTIDAIESFEGNRKYRRESVTIEYDGTAVRLISPTIGGEHEAAARRMFDLDADSAAIDEHLGRDPILRRLIAQRPGTRVPGAWSPFELAVRAIVGQQISVRGATTIMNRLSPILTPAQLAAADIPGMPRSRSDAIRGMARAVAEDPALLLPGGMLDAAIERLTALRGIGPWTAHYIAMRALGHGDAFPESDLGLRKAAAALRIRNLSERAERWRPYRAYAAMMLWEAL